MASASEAISVIQSNDRVYVHQGCAQPEPLIDAMIDRAGELRNVEVVHMATMGSGRYTQSEYRESFRHNALFIGANVRGAVQQRRADYIPIFLGEIEGLFTDGTLPLDVALLQTTLPDRNGFVSLGPSIDVSLTAAKVARHVVAVTNPRMPRTHGDTYLHVSEIDTFVEEDFPLAELEPRTPLDEHRAIARHVAALIPDGATMQMGIGAIPDAILDLLGNHKHLGVHSEMFSDGIIPLLEKGVIDNSNKKINPNKVVAGFALGSHRLLDYIHENPIFEFRQTRYTNDPFQIARNPKVCAVNAAIEVDLTGQICADSLGELPFSGIGGQVDFIRGAARSEGGMPFLCLPATAKGGKLSRIVSQLKPGAGVVTSRGDVHWVVTEFGAVNLHGKNLRQRAQLLISIAHPDFREQLERESFALRPA
ncbi:MAG: acetyl-CoA hydrolase/transferase family protein [Acidobacteria bacterium]|nr:acetyl-CoA hydrolase/transferase family protein [Acidobacteriota bacterium]